MNNDYEQRTCVLQCRVTPSELERIKERMKAAGIKSRSGFMRKLVLTGFIICLDLSEVNEVTRLLRICSNNLNQYAKKANESGVVRQQDIDQLKLQMEELWEAQKSLLQKLANLP